MNLIVPILIGYIIVISFVGIIAFVFNKVTDKLSYYLLGSAILPTAMLGVAFIEKGMPLAVLGLFELMMTAMFGCVYLALLPEIIRAGNEAHETTNNGVDA